MVRTEQYAWASLVMLIAIFGWFQMQMLRGWRIAEQPADALLGIYAAVIVLSTIAEIAIAILLSGIARGKAPVRDERDYAITARANENERLFMIFAINFVVWQALWEGAFAGHAIPKLDFANLPTLFFVLFTILFAGEIVKRLSTIWLYRTQAPFSFAPQR